MRLPLCWVLVPLILRRRLLLQRTWLLPRLAPAPAPWSALLKHTHTHMHMHMLLSQLLRTNSREHILQ